jgi:hypothetical protein
MSKRTLQWIVVVFVGGLVGVVWLIHRPASDEARYRNMLCTRNAYTRALAAEHGRFGSFVQVVHPASHFLNKYRTEREALLASGFLTNVTLRLPADKLRRDEWYKREAVLVHSTNMVVLLPIVSTNENEEMITCRTCDITALRRALGE